MLEAMAWRDLHDPNIGGKLKAEQLYDLAKQAGVAEEDIQKIVRQRAEERLNNDLEP